MVESDSEVEIESDKTYKICACGKKVKAIYQNDLCRECLTDRFKMLTKVIDSVRK
ncbi:MAG: hypothetical protein O9346_10035 [Leptospiraceae bacterium]|nr:hypothetical protein [Leptospiraceae bacterium]